VTNSTRFKKGQTPWNKGRKGLQVAWNKGIPMSDEVKAKVSNSKKGNSPAPNKGKKASPETIEKQRQSKLKNPTRYWLGKQRSPETLQKISEAKTGKYTGANSWNWIDGRSKIDRLVRRMTEYYQWRSDVFTRDKWTCKTCGKNGCYVTAHHIKGLNLIIKENIIKDVLNARLCEELWDINNGITLCEDCHKLTDNYAGRGQGRRSYE